MKMILRLLGFLAWLLAVGGAGAAVTNIAQVPLLNVAGTGTVRPNLMLLYDNSGSMASAFTPDYIDDSTTCRSKALMSSGTRSCTVGMPPFTSADFNHQYYDPDVRYTPPVYADGTSYPSMTRSATSAWTSVTTDGFGINKRDLWSNSASSTNLVTGFPDIRWCDTSGNNCVYNTATYTYPNDSRYTAYTYTTNPYYYTINAAEYCTDATLTTCTSVTVGASAPTGYPVPAKVRWCTTTALTTCQAKYVGSYKYPRFSNPNTGLIAAYGTIVIATSSSTSSVSVNSVTVAESGGTVTISNGTVTASTGTSTGTKAATFATSIAASIIAKTGLTNQYVACVTTPTPSTSSVPACSTYGITLSGTNVVAVIPIDCASGTSGKATGVCSVVTDNSRAGWAIGGSTTNSALFSTTPLGAGNAVFVRTDIVATRTSYPKAAGRADCAGTTCTYDEEMTNFANWYAYYKTRNQMMKTAVGQSVQPLNSNYNVGIVSLSTAAAEGSMTPPQQFTGSARTNWYNSLYAMDGSNSTPMRQALHAIGKMYANLSPYTKAAGSEVVQYPCQQNFTFITTDGYWNGAAAATVVNNDNKINPDRFCTQQSGCYDPSAQSYNSLADVALYWYNGGSNTGTVSLRPSIDDVTTTGSVGALTAGDNTHLHMNTYALGLGVDGVMNYEENYDKSPSTSGDFYKLVTGVTKGCTWNNNGAYVWPDPVTTDSSGSAAYQSRVDDLWHAAINGHGKYFSASDPTSVVKGLSAALANIQVRVGAASAAATSTPNISQQDNDIFASTFTTVRWYGEMTDRKIDVVSGEVSSAVTWSSSDMLGRQVTTTTGRKIYMVNAATNALQDFLYANLTTTEKTWFDNKCTALAQCSTLSDADRAIVNAGSNLIYWLRGQQQYADDAHFRSYTLTDHTPTGLSAPIPTVLGDIASSKPAYLRDPRKSYTTSGYSDYKTAQANRSPTVFVAANDGMLHAFKAADGSELWAYAPRITMKKLYLQASTTYATNHQYTTDGSPEIGDVQFGTVWHSVLVAGLNAGGRGFYALDVTNPTTPVPLWELCADSSVCANNDPDLGLSFGNPQFGTWKDASGSVHWVVFLTSGYNNVSGTDGVATGGGLGYLYVVDAQTGKVLSKTSTGDGSTGTPSGFAKITAVTANPQTDPLVTYVYGGDNQGKMFRFDFTAGGNPVVLQMADAGAAQPVTTSPEVTLCEVDSTDGAGNTTAGVSKMVVYGTGRLLDVPDIANTDLQSVYVLKDSGTGISATDWRTAAKMPALKLSPNTVAGVATYSISGPTLNLSTQAGWYIDFNQNAGERVNLDPKVVAGTLNVVTNIPTSSSACDVGGTSNLYQMDVCTAKPLLTDANGNTIVGQALSSSAAAVGFIIVRLPNGSLKLIGTTADGGNVTMGMPPATAAEAHKAGWRRVHE